MVFKLLLGSNNIYGNQFVWENEEYFDTLSEDGVASENEGYVLSFKDSVVTIKGLENVKANELLYFEGGASGVALNLEYSIVKALVFGGSNSVKTSETVRRSHVVMRVGVGDGVLGRILDPLGKPIDGNGEVAFDDF